MGTEKKGPGRNPLTANLVTLRIGFGQLPLSLYKYLEVGKNVADIFPA